MASKSIIFTNSNLIQAVIFQEMMCKWSRIQIFLKIQGNSAIVEIAQIQEEIQEEDGMRIEAEVEEDISEAKTLITTKSHRCTTIDQSSHNNRETRVEIKSIRKDIKEDMRDRLTGLRSQRSTKTSQR